MAFLKYRTGNSPTVWSSQPSNGTALTNAEIDSNFATLNDKKPDSGDITLQLVVGNNNTTDKLAKFTHADGVQLRKLQAWSTSGIEILGYGGGTAVQNTGTISIWGGYGEVVTDLTVEGASTYWKTVASGGVRASGGQIVGAAVQVLGGSAELQGKEGSGFASGGSVEIHGGSCNTYEIGNSAWDGTNQSMQHGTVNIGTVLEVSGRATSYINIGHLNYTNVNTGYYTHPNWKSSLTTIKGDVAYDNVNTVDSAGATWSLSSPAVVINTFTYPRFDAVGAFSKRTGYWYSPISSSFGGIRLGSSTSSYLYSADFYQLRTEIYGYNVNSGVDYSALKVTQASSAPGLSIVAADDKHIQLKAQVTSNDRGPRIGLNHTSGNRGDVLSFLINPYYQTSGVVDQYIEMGFVGPWGIGGNNVQAGTVYAADLANRRYTRGYLLGNDTAFYKTAGTGNSIILVGGYQDYVSSTWVTKYSVSGYAIKQEMNWGGNDYNMFSWHRSDSAGPNTAGSNISSWVEMMRLGVDAIGSTHSLNVSGKIYASNSITSSGDVISYSSSDMNMKTNILRIDSALSKVNSIDGVTFNWKEETGKDTNRREAGVIAQQVQEVLPEVVMKREDGTLGVRYEQLVPLLVEAIKELSEKVENLQNQLNNK